MSQGGRHRKTASPFRLAIRRTAVGMVSFLAASSGVGVAQASGLLNDMVAVQASDGGKASPDAGKVSPDPLSKRIAHLDAKHDCSKEGLAPGVIPARTVVMVDGHVHVA